MKNTIRFFVCLAVICGVFLTSPERVEAQTNPNATHNGIPVTLTCGQTLSSGEYKLTADFNCPDPVSSGALIFGENNITFDLNGHIFSGNYSLNQNGIFSDGKVNITITNTMSTGGISDFSAGIASANPEGTIFNVNNIHFQHIGAIAVLASNAIIENNTADDVGGNYNGYGVFFSGFGNTNTNNNIIIRNNTVTNAKTPTVRLYGFTGTGATIEGNTFTGVSADAVIGLSLFGTTSTNIQIKNNKITRPSVSPDPAVAVGGADAGGVTNLIMIGNEITNGTTGAPAVFLTNVADATVYHNAFITNGVRFSGDKAYELWNHITNEGNYWGHSCPSPFFINGGTSTPFDANRPDIIDNFAYGVKDGWLLPAGSPGSMPCNTPPPISICPQVTTQPGDQIVCEGSEVSFSAEASGSPAPTLQWEVSFNGGSTWTNTGSDTSPLSFSASVSQNGSKYRAVFTNSCGSATSSEATLVVNSPPTVSIAGTVSALCSLQSDDSDDEDEHHDADNEEEEEDDDDDDEKDSGGNSPQHSYLLGVTVDIFDASTGELTATATTDANGNYSFSELSAGEYLVSIHTPIGYSTTSSEVQVALGCGDEATVNYDLTCSNLTGSPRSIGFWKHQFSVATGERGTAQINAATLCNYLDIIQEHFNEHPVNPVVVYQPPLSNNCSDKLNAGKSVMNIKGSVPKITKARQQLFALLMNVSAGFLHQASIVSEDGATVAQAITYCDNLIDNPNGNYERAKDIAEEIIEGEMLEEGRIPLTTPDIRYKTVVSDVQTEHGNFFLRQNFPNPFNPVTTITYSLPEDARVSIKVIDVLGQVVATLVDEIQDAGSKSQEWNASSIPSGIYYYQLNAVSIYNPTQQFYDIKKTVLLK